MRKVIWTAMVAILLAGSVPAGASQAAQPRSKQRVERLQQLRERMAERRAQRAQRTGQEQRIRRQRVERLRDQTRARLDRNRDGRVSRGEMLRHRMAIRRHLRQFGR